MRVGKKPEVWNEIVRDEKIRLAMEGVHEAHPGPVQGPVQGPVEAPKATAVEVPKVEPVQGPEEAPKAKAKGKKVK